MKVTWGLPDGREITGEATEGTSLMEAALANDVPLVLGECGGNMSCATCHVIVVPGWRDLSGTPGEFEDAMLDVTAAERQEGSRLSCQIRMHAGLDGIKLLVPRP